MKLNCRHKHDRKHGIYSCGLVGSLHGDFFYENEIELLVGNVKLSFLVSAHTGINSVRHLKPQMKQY